MPKLNPKEAPYGFLARLEEEDAPMCSGCYFADIPDAPCTRQGPVVPGPSCLAYSRKDRCGVIFVKDTEPPCL